MDVSSAKAILVVIEGNQATITVLSKSEEDNDLIMVNFLPFAPSHKRRFITPRIDV